MATFFTLKCNHEHRIPQGTGLMKLNHHAPESTPAKWLRARGSAMFNLYSQSDKILLSMQCVVADYPPLETEEEKEDRALAVRMDFVFGLKSEGPVVKTPTCTEYFKPYVAPPREPITVPMENVGYYDLMQAFALVFDSDYDIWVFLGKKFPDVPIDLTYAGSKGLQQIFAAVSLETVAVTLKEYILYENY